ncbi:MAG: sel1 repeat family protein [Pseudaminobacter sp.]|nr:sel1 repeat family protein [Pseudaminobacter sp.]
MPKNYVHAAILVCAALTMASTVGVWHLRKHVEIKTALRTMDVSAKRETAEVAANRLSALAAGKEQPDLEEELVIFVQSRSASFIRRVVDILIFERRDAFARSLGVILAEHGALMYHYPPLLIRAGYEFGSGRFVEQDFKKAANLLSDPAVENLASAKFYLGELLLLEENLERDPSRGLKLIREAAQMDFPPAAAQLRLLEQGLKQKVH